MIDTTAVVDYFISKDIEALDNHLDDMQFAPMHLTKHEMDGFLEVQ